MSPRLLIATFVLAGCAAPPPKAPKTAPVVEVKEARPAAEPPPVAAEEPMAEDEEPVVEELDPSTIDEENVAVLGVLKGSSSSGFGALGIQGPGGTGLKGASPAKPGALDRDEIQREMRRNIPKYRACYEAQLKKDPNLTGKVVLRFEIAPGGSVASAEIREGVHPEVDDCVKQVALGMAFPKPRGGGKVVVSYPLVFNTSP